jgi:hypothetical protein
VCVNRKGRCNGFDPRADVWVVCEAMLTHLIDPPVRSTCKSLTIDNIV